jgi:hypothetical protein
VRFDPFLSPLVALQEHRHTGTAFGLTGRTDRDSILYDRLQSTVAPTNPYALSSAAHLATLASSSSSASTSSSVNAPPTILQTPSYPLADPQAPTLFLQQLDAQKLAAVQHGVVGGGVSGTNLEFGAKPVEGVEGEAQQAREHEKLLKAGGGAIMEPQEEAQAATAAAGRSGGAVATSAVHGTGTEPPAAAVPQAVGASQADAQPMQTDQQQP